jgi:hypothetical protein
MKRVYPSPGLYTAIVRDVARPRAARLRPTPMCCQMRSAGRAVRAWWFGTIYPKREASRFHFAASADRRSRMAPGAVKKSLYRRGRLTMTRGPPLQRMSTGVRARGGPFGAASFRRRTRHTCRRDPSPSQSSRHLSGANLALKTTFFRRTKSSRPENRMSCEPGRKFITHDRVSANPKRLGFDQKLDST